MSYICVKVMPNYIPITTNGDIHYCGLEFIIYKSEREPIRTAWSGCCRSPDQDIKEGAEIIISGKMAEPGAPDSEDAFCVISDVPSAGYAYQYPEGWGCSHNCEGDGGRLSFVVSAPSEGGESFETAVVRVRGFFTTAREGACGLHVKVRNFQSFVPDAEDSEFTVTLSKKYCLEICRFTANERVGKFFLNHSLPVLFHWDVVCDTDTPLSLLEDGITISPLQEFTGEKLLDGREKGDHTYTLKMILPAGEKTDSIMIRDTLWKKREPSTGLIPDFSLQGRFLTWRNRIYVFYDNKVYRADAGRGDDWQQFQELCKYDGSVTFAGDTMLAAGEDRLYLIGGVKSGSTGLYYAVYDLKGKEDGWKDYDMWQDGKLFGGSSACETSASLGQWIVYAKREGDFAVFMEYDPGAGNFAGKYGVNIPGMQAMETGIRKNVLCLAAAVEEGILIKRLKKGDVGFSDAGTILLEEMPKWMRWAEGGGEMFLWTDAGLFGEGGWKAAEDFQPPYPKGTYPWSGMAAGKLVSLFQGEEGDSAVQAWETDILCGNLNREKNEGGFANV